MSRKTVKSTTIIPHPSAVLDERWATYERYPQPTEDADLQRGQAARQLRKEWQRWEREAGLDIRRATLAPEAGRWTAEGESSAADAARVHFMMAAARMADLIAAKVRHEYREHALRDCYTQSSNKDEFLDRVAELYADDPARDVILGVAPFYWDANDGLTPRYTWPPDPEDETSTPHNPGLAR